ncbi:MAG: hypothetical protein GC184_11455 [Rhizobiales bacterium]|nr:hypothetical protein [Hyphomicrobiales bacterium]
MAAMFSGLAKIQENLMKCVLHIGTEKTGTTLLQQWLYENRDELGRQKIYLSGILGVPVNRLFAGYFQHQLDEWAERNKILSFEDKAKYFDGFLERLSDEIKSASTDHKLFLISSEHLHSRVSRREDIETIKSFLSDHFESVEIICYFRPQTDMAVSLYSTMVRMDYTHDVETFVQEHLRDNSYYYNYKEIADNWSSVFGKENCHFKIYDLKKFAEKDLRIDFITLLPVSVNREKLTYKTRVSNRSTSGLRARAFRIINRYVPFWDDRNGQKNPLNDRLKNLIANNKSLAHGVITSRARDEIEKKFAASNRDFFAEYFDDETSFSTNARLDQNDRHFSYEQVEILVSTLLEDLMPFISLGASQRLSDRDADCLRDIALKIEAGQQLSTRDALELMQLARRARPDGALIKRKIADYAAQVESGA